MARLVEIAKALAQRTISFEEAARRAHEWTAPAEVRGLPGRVARSMGETQRELDALTSWVADHSYADTERWVGAFVMLQALLGLGMLPVAIDLVRRVAATRPLPNGAADMVSAMIDRVLTEAAAVPSAVVDQLLALRRAVYDSAEADPSRMIDTIVDCFDHERWEYDLDRARKLVRIGFSFPFGETTLVCAASQDNGLIVFALNVVRTDGSHMPDIEAELAARFPGVLSAVEPDGFLSLHYTVPSATSLTRHDVRNAVVHVNGAAEFVTMRMRPKPR